MNTHGFNIKLVFTMLVLGLVIPLHIQFHLFNIFGMLRLRNLSTELIWKWECCSLFLD